MQTHPMHADHSGARSQPQLSLLDFARLALTQLDPGDVTRQLRAVGGANIREPNRHLLGRLVGHERATALTAKDQVLPFHLIQSLTDCARADVQLARQVHLVRERVAGLPFPGGNPADEKVPDLQIERPC